MWMGRLRPGTSMGAELANGSYREGARAGGGQLPEAPVLRLDQRRRPEAPAVPQRRHAARRVRIPFELIVWWRLRHWRRLKISRTPPGVLPVYTRALHWGPLELRWRR